VVSLHPSCHPTSASEQDSNLPSVREWRPTLRRTVKAAVVAAEPATPGKGLGPLAHRELVRRADYLITGSASPPVEEGKLIRGREHADSSSLHFGSPHAFPPSNS
jgi:hypothetical protein